VPVVSRESLLLYWTTEIRTNRVQGMEMQILPLVLLLTGCLVGIRSVAIRSLAVARLRISSPRNHVRGRQRRLPPLPATAGGKG